MRKILIFLLIMLIGSAIPAASAGEPVTQQQALAIAKAQYSQYQADYFLVDDSTSTEWILFIDAEPLKNWEHLCYMMTIPKVNTNPGTTPNFTQAQLSMPPFANYIPLEINNYFGDNAMFEPYLPTLAHINYTAASHVYAIILSGGGNPAMNYARYWNDCSFIYQTLTKTYGVPKSNITPIMADGTDPSPDTRPYQPEKPNVSQRLDLDFDGNNEIELAATKSNVQESIKQLRSSLSDEDQVFLYVIDHGGLCANEEPYIVLWNNDSLLASELASLLSPFKDLGICVNVVLGQCYSGGFIDYLTQAGCVVAAACAGDEYSMSCFDRPYDEFVYHWTCAVNKADHTGNSIANIDKDNNNLITMDEAFLYASTHDRFLNYETPQYCSTPYSIGEELSFYTIPPKIDLFVKDNVSDTGKEPYLTDYSYWKSPSLSFRTNLSESSSSLKPYPNIPDSCYIDIRIHNRGRSNYVTGQYLNLYYSLLSPAVSASAWKGNEYLNEQTVTGNLIGNKVIPPISSDGYADLSFSFAYDDFMALFSRNYSPSFLASISGSPTNSDFDVINGMADVIYHNDLGQLSLTTISHSDYNKTHNILLRNSAEIQDNFSIKFIPNSYTDSLFFRNNSIEIILSPSIRRAWERGGMRGVDVGPAFHRELTDGSLGITLTTVNACLDSILLASHEVGTVGVKFNIISGVLGKKTTLDLVQTNLSVIGRNPIIGGITYELTPTPLVFGGFEISKTDGHELITNCNSEATINWYNENHVLIGNQNSLELTRTLNNQQVSATTFDENGNLATATFSIGQEFGIENVSMSNASDLITVELKQLPTKNGKIIISLSNTSSILKEIRLDENHSTYCTTIDKNGPMVYNISYFEDETLVDSKKLITQY